MKKLVQLLLGAFACGCKVSAEHKGERSKLFFSHRSRLRRRRLGYLSKKQAQWCWRVWVLVLAIVSKIKVRDALAFFPFAVKQSSLSCVFAQRSAGRMKWLREI